ncbi:hypothetical protein [Thermoactinomyces mirandus]|uniref:Uncharacterized protein n=1 Tax=Thermoactinomyces mirandus TaxID=2756294 RepID=A0A7W2AQD8_9BACL|nr:hypothetical protein [Thermoactinomyces mirandus]MBA4601864.1 hypothetical protein [Thermoactinomyces mirandus]
MLRLIVEGYADEVKAFLKEFASLPQHDVKFISKVYQNDILENGKIRSFCNFEYHPLDEIDQPVTVTFATKEGKNLSFTLLQGNVFRAEDIITISGKVAAGLLK